jgi:hypothetical protein
MRRVRIILDSDQIERIASLGNALVVVGRGSWPDAGGHYVLHAVEAESIKAVSDAVDVATGAKAARRRPGNRARIDGDGAEGSGT